MHLHISHHDAQTAFLDQLSTLMNACTDLDDDQLLAASRCRGWTVSDVIVHVHLGLQDMLLGLVAPTNAEPDTDAASYWRAGLSTNDSDADQVAAARFVRLLGAAYRRPTGLVHHLRPYRPRHRDGSDRAAAWCSAISRTCAVHRRFSRDLGS